MMKKLVLFMAIAFTVSLTACKKDYTCTCTFGSGGSSDAEYKSVKKKDAEEACSETETELKKVDSAGSCKLK